LKGQYVKKMRYIAHLTIFWDRGKRWYLARDKSKIYLLYRGFKHYPRVVEETPYDMKTEHKLVDIFNRLNKYRSDVMIVNFKKGVLK